MVVQIGNGATEPGESVQGLEVEWYRLKSSIHEDMKTASLIISHGGERERARTRERERERERRERESERARMGGREGEGGK